MIPFFIGLLSVLLGIVSVLIVFIVLMQRPKQEGLGAAFGGGMTDQMFGAQTTNVLQKGTVYLAVMFFFFSMVLSVLTAKSVRGDSDTIDELKAAEAPPAAVELPTGTIPGGSVTTPPVQVSTTPLTGQPEAGTEPAKDDEKPEAGTEPAKDDEIPEAGTEPANDDETPEADTEPANDDETPEADTEPAELDETPDVPAAIEDAAAEVPVAIEEAGTEAEVPAVTEEDKPGE